MVCIFHNWYPYAYLLEKFSIAHVLIFTFVYALSSREGNGTPLQYFCLENCMDGGAWWAAVHGVMKSGTQLSDFTFTFHFHALEKEMATHSSVLAWKIPWTDEPGGLQCKGLQRVRHDWATKHIHNELKYFLKYLFIECNVMAIPFALGILARTIYFWEVLILRIPTAEELRA